MIKWNVIEARGAVTHDEYLTLERRGRGLPLRANLREAIWAVYVAWSAELEHQGLTTWERVRRQALELALSQPTRPYQAVIIDEAQDLSPVALRFLLASVATPQGIYLTADASQSLYQRGFSWKQIHSDLNMRGRTVLLRRNYRNTAAITAACAAILAAPTLVTPRASSRSLLRTRVSPRPSCWRTTIRTKPRPSVASSPAPPANCACRCTPERCSAIARRLPSRSPPV